MPEADDILSREVAIAAKLEENGIALRTKSRAVAAFDRLVGSLFDVPAAFFEGVSRKKRLRDEIYGRLKNAQLLIAEQQIANSPELGASLIGDVLEDKARKQTNLSGVAVEAIDAIRALPPPNISSNGEENEVPLDDIDEDWMNQFLRFAEDASSENLQQVWGRVLAGEIRKPGSFSRHTLRFVAELDKETAENCQHMGQYVVGRWLLKDEKWNSGNDFLISVDLQRLGIVEGLGFGGPQQTFVIDEDGFAGIAGNTWGLLVRGTPETKIAFPVFMLTRLGQEIMSLVNEPLEDVSLRNIAESLDKSALKSIELGKVTPLPNGQVVFPGPMQRIWTVSLPDSTS